ncbi:hypothetical protein Tco_0890831 [Tanacetum coccineum]|uniref:Transmembrane protein n=1 Tax=Tanacetum coccineum TaxID=301880 RepID=A0ABQ5C6Q1_9ASTR
MHDPRDPYITALKRFFAFVVVLLIMLCSFIVSSTYYDYCVFILMDDWAGCLLLVGHHPCIVCFLAESFINGLRNVQVTCLVLVLKLNIDGVANVVAEYGLDPVICYVSLHTTSTLLYLGSIETMLVLSICLQIQFNINARNTFRSTFILFVSLLLRDKFEFFMSLQDSSMQIFF